MARHNPKGRSKGGPSFLQLYRYMLDSAAWLSLAPQDRAVYLEVAQLYNGKNNGFLAVSVRAAAERVRINKDTAAKCFARLQDRGLLECAQAGSYDYKVKHATEWRLTTHKCDRTGQPPSKAFARWRPADAKPGPLISDARSPDFGQVVPLRTPTVPSFRTVEAR